MNTSKSTYIRKSSFYLTDAISCHEFVNETRFHNNLHLASTYAKQNGWNLQDKAGDSGLMPYQYEYDKSLKIYSITIDLEMVGKDENFNMECNNEEKAKRVIAILAAIESLNLVVKGNLDNAEPIFLVGGLSERKTHYFENVVNVNRNYLKVNNDLIDRVQSGYKVGLLESGILTNEEEIVEKLNAMSVTKMFKQLEQDINDFYGV